VKSCAPGKKLRKLRDGGALSSCFSRNWYTSVPGSRRKQKVFTGKLKTRPIKIIMGKSCAAIINKIDQ